MTPINAEKYVGFILLKAMSNENNQQFIEFLCAHNTQTMCFGHMTTHQNKVTTVFSELKSGESLTINLDFISST
ncbi:unnamed protein product [Adineta ricciae]|nr:unnamed protein product [Adineta ricciae]